MKRAALINDLSCFGKCSLSVALPILSAYGVEAVSLPTAILSTHTGGFEGYVVRDMTDEMRAFSAHWKRMGLKFDLISTGFFSSPEQLDKAMVVTSPMSWAVLAGVALIVAAAVAWRSWADSR